MPYDRWSMDPSKASALTGVTVGDADLEAAELEVRDVIGWAPDPDSYSTEVDGLGQPVDRRVVAFGRAVAWQAAHRLEDTASAGDAPARIASEGIGSGDYTVTYAGSGKAEGGLLGARTRSLLASGGWLARRMAGYTRP